MKTKFFTFLFMTCSLAGFSIDHSQIKGLVTDENKNPQPYATVLLKTSADSSLFKGEITNDKGEFYFENIKAGNYYLQIQITGLEKNTISNIIISDTTSSIDLGTIVMTTKSKDLKEVNVKADKPFIEQQVDKTVVNIENSIIQNGSSIMEVMEKLPGVIVDQNGTISLKGKQGVIILIDGKQTVLSGQDLANMLRSMPSSGIQKIEIITNPSAKYDAAGNAGIINIVMKKNKREGFNGNINVGYRQGRYSKYVGSLSLNYKNKWYNLFLNYSYSHRLDFNNLTIDRKFYGADTLNTVFRTENYILFPSENHNPRLGADFYLSKKTTLSLLGTGSVSQLKPSTVDHTNIFDGKNNLVKDYDFINNSKENWYNYAVNAELKHEFDTTGQELTVDLDYANYWNNTDQYYKTTYYNPDGSFSNQDVLLNNQKSNLYLYSAKADYTKPMKKERSFDAGLKSSYVSSDNNILFYNVINDATLFDSLRSSHFLYSENINAAYINFKKDYKKFSYQLGLRAEQTIAKGKQVLNSQTFNRDYLQVFPTAFFDFKVSEKNDINLSLGRRIDRPAYEQMNPYKSLINATTFSEGNPYLLPQLTYNTELTYSHNSVFFATLAYSFTTNNITDILIQDSQTQTTVQTIVNLDKLNYYSLNLTYSKKLTKWWTTNTSVLSYYGIYTGNINKNHINQGSPSFYLNTGNSFSIMDGLSAEANFQYNYKNLYGITLMNTTYNFSIGIQKSVLKKKGTIILNMNDILWTAYPSGITKFDNVREDWTAKRDTRVFNISFSYKFGDGKAARIRRNTGADDEKSRIQSN
ncbi:MAG: outer membrane beta-barrel protein [Bacteroidia bacterium]